ncbi:SDR family oxidoreductase [Paenibacillus kobensis]|uniref:SDR family oxidoreductase n=1 Tax=Paenibacillus kobensis TaxID=59841 RepID=UPI000FD8D4D0|nr:SDR family oxidoreductase [Paenibacillus kobensis]
MLKNKKVVIIGGSSGIGLETARQAAAEGAEVIIASRTEEKLRTAVEALGVDKAAAFQLDTTDEERVRSFFGTAGPIDHLVITAAETAGGPFLSTDSAQARQLFDNKFWGQYYAAKYGAPRISPQGSITLFSGIVAYKAMAGSAALGAVNAAVAALGRTLALELAPVRVNVVSPGIIDTPSRSKMAPEARQQLYASLAGKLPAQRVGTADDVARTVLYLMTNSFVTGTVAHVEGGHLLM